MSPIGLLRCLKIKTTHFSPFIMYQVVPLDANSQSVQPDRDTDNNSKENKKETQSIVDKKNNDGTYSSKVVKINDVPRTGDKTNIELWNRLVILNIGIAYFIFLILQYMYGKILQ